MHCRHVMAGASVIRGFAELSVPDGFTYTPGTRASCCMTSFLLHVQGMDFKRQETQVSRPFKDCSQNWHSVSSAVRAVPGLAQIYRAREMQCLLVGMCQGSLPRHVWEGRLSRPSVEKYHLPHRSSCSVYRNRQNKCVITCFSQSYLTSLL